jgi:hypothetical protein
MKAMKAILGSLGVIAVLAGAAYAQDPLGAAKDLYAAAAYEEALSRLSQLSNGAAPDVVRQIDQYRAFSLFALGRVGEAEQVAEALIRRNPLLKPTEGEAPPRIEAMFAAVRKRTLSVLIRDEYRMAREAIDKSDMAAAEPHLRLASQLIAAVRATGQIDDTLADLSLLVDGFLGLSQTAAGQTPARQQPPRPTAAAPAATPTASSAPPRTGSTPPAVASQSGTSSTAAAGPPQAPQVTANGTATARAATIYSGPADSHLTPPVVINQASPELPRAVSEVMRRTAPKNLVVDLVINERGDVQEATLREPGEQVYDLLVLRTARLWKYRPATVDGVPVKYRKSVSVSFLE